MRKKPSILKSLLSLKRLSMLVPVVTKKKMTFSRIKKASKLFHLFIKKVYGPIAMILITISAKNSQIKIESNILASSDS
jgi:hypothetical protein